MEASTHDEASRKELERMMMEVEKYSARLDELDTQLATIAEENENDDVNQQIMEYNKSTGSKKNIAAEDALDHIVRLQNQLKIVRRRNQLLDRENATQKRHVRERAKKLASTTKELGTVVDATGWHEGMGAVHMDKARRAQTDVHDMAVVETEMHTQISANKITMAMRDKQILKMTKEVEAEEERRMKYMQLRNDVRVKQQAIDELLAQKGRMEHDTSQMQLVIAKEDESENVTRSLLCMESDKEFLSDAVHEMRVACRLQEDVVSAQIFRQQQLQDRLDIVMKSLKEMKLLREYERNVARSALVPNASREEPRTPQDVVPENEMVPIETYRLLYKNSESMRTSVARKNMLVLEKDSAAMALESKVARYIDRHNDVARRDDMTQMNNSAAAGELGSDLRVRREALQDEVEALREESIQLKSQLSHNASAATSVKRGNGIRKK